MAVATKSKKTTATNAGTTSKTAQMRQAREAQTSSRRRAGESPAVTPNAVVLRDGGTSVPVEAEPKSATPTRAPVKREGPSVNEAIKQILADKKPQHTNDITAAALKLCPSLGNGKTPAATVSARLSVGAKNGVFKKTAPGTYKLA